MTWAFKRQIFYLTILLLFIAVFGFLIAYPYFNKTPTCFDNKQNGDESGIDCGGACVKACVFETDEVSVLWARSFLVVPKRYNAIAYLENHNKNLAIPKIKYQFRFADKDNIYLGRREGVASIPPGRNFAIFERGIELGNSDPIYTTFSFTETPNWISVPDNKINQLQVLVSNVNLENEQTSPHLSATLKNNSLFVIPDIKVIAILYDANHNAISASSTYLDKLSGEEEKVINFTWPLPFSAKTVTKEILPSYNIFDVKLK